MVAPNSQSSTKPSPSFPRHAVVPIILVHHLSGTKLPKLSPGWPDSYHSSATSVDRCSSAGEHPGRAPAPLPALLQPLEQRVEGRWCGAALSTSWATGLGCGEVNKQKHKQE